MHLSHQVSITTDAQLRCWQVWSANGKTATKGLLMSWSMLILGSRCLHVDSIRLFNTWPLEEMRLGDDADLHSADSSRAKGSIHRGFALARRHRRSWATVALGSAAHHSAQRHLRGSLDQRQSFGMFLEVLGSWCSFHLVFSIFSSFRPFSARFISFPLAWSRLISHHLDLSYFSSFHLSSSHFNLVWSCFILFHLVPSRLSPLISFHLGWSHFT